MCGWYMPSKNNFHIYPILGVRHEANMKYELMLSNPKDFYHEVHRPSHFMNFTSIEEGDAVAADMENAFQ